MLVSPTLSSTFYLLQNEVRYPKNLIRSTSFYKIVSPTSMEMVVLLEWKSIRDLIVTINFMLGYNLSGVIQYSIKFLT